MSLHDLLLNESDRNDILYSPVVESMFGCTRADPIVHIIVVVNLIFHCLHVPFMNDPSCYKANETWMTSAPGSEPPLVLSGVISES